MSLRACQAPVQGTARWGGGGEGESMVGVVGTPSSQPTCLAALLNSRAPPRPPTISSASMVLLVPARGAGRGDRC